MTEQKCQCWLQNFLVNSAILTRIVHKLANKIVHASTFI